MWHPFAPTKHSCTTTTWVTAATGAYYSGVGQWHVQWHQIPYCCKQVFFFFRLLFFIVVIIVTRWSFCFFPILHVVIIIPFASCIVVAIAVWSVFSFNANRAVPNTGKPRQNTEASAWAVPTWVHLTLSLSLLVSRQQHEKNKLNKMYFAIALHVVLNLITNLQDFVSRFESNSFAGSHPSDGRAGLGERCHHHQCLRGVLTTTATATNSALPLQWRISLETWEMSTQK